jgi:hypothetical protein
MADAITIRTVDDAEYLLGRRLRLQAFVCGVTCVKRTDGKPPTATFTQIYQQRPADCRYAIVSQWSLARHVDAYFVFDLFEVKKDASTGELIEPKPRLSHYDLDAAISGRFMTCAATSPGPAPDNSTPRRHPASWCLRRTRPSATRS